MNASGLEFNGWCVQIAEGLEYLHKQDHVHGDLKAESVFITDNSEIGRRSAVIGGIKATVLLRLAHAKSAAVPDCIATSISSKQQQQCLAGHVATSITSKQQHQQQLSLAGHVNERAEKKGMNITSTPSSACTASSRVEKMESRKKLEHDNVVVQGSDSLLGKQELNWKPTFLAGFASESRLGHDKAAKATKSCLRTSSQKVLKGGTRPPVHGFPSSRFSTEILPAWTDPGAHFPTSVGTRTSSTMSASRDLSFNTQIVQNLTAYSKGHRTSILGTCQSVDRPSRVRTTNPKMWASKPLMVDLSSSSCRSGKDWFERERIRSVGSGSSGSERVLQSPKQLSAALPTAVVGEEDAVPTPSPKADVSNTLNCIGFRGCRRRL
eukprot:gene21490-28467_t